jgi:redox-sensitive bicupin YhaK (pirin superfamily)
MRKVKVTEQARGQFNGGEILENKPIGFPREGGMLKPYSNLFYWAHAWSDNGSTIGLHPHQGFEILSFVLQGSIEHYDTKMDTWRAIDTGGAQIIRAGDGISHSEKLNAGAHMFQIWFDPNLNKTLKQPASYNDYQAEQLKKTEGDKWQRIDYAGNQGPLKMDSPGIEIFELKLDAGANFKVEASKDKVYSCYLITGKASMNEVDFEKDDFGIAYQTELIEIKNEAKTRIFIVGSPLAVDYPTYAQSAQGH